MVPTKLPSGNVSPRIAAGDRLAKWRRFTAKAISDRGCILQHELRAAVSRLSGDTEGALRHLAESIRFTQVARESIPPYRRVRRLLERGGGVLADPPMDAARPSAYVLFVGHGRSGHSLVGSLLDAHPDIVISHELHALKHIRQGVPYDDVADATKLNARIFHAFGRHYTGYDYVVPGQHQGHCRELRLLGDKKGNGTARLLRSLDGRSGQDLDSLAARFPVPVVFVNVVRNPYDNIATKARRTGTSPAYAARGYFANTEVVARLHEHASTRVIDVYLDDLIADPRSTLRDLLVALGMDPEPPGYLEACAGIMFSTPSRTREKMPWDHGLVDWIEDRMAAYPFLSRYTGDPPRTG